MATEVRLLSFHFMFYLCASVPLWLYFEIFSKKAMGRMPDTFPSARRAGWSEGARRPQVSVPPSKQNESLGDSGRESSDESALPLLKPRGKPTLTRCLHLPPQARRRGR